MPNFNTAFPSRFLSAATLEQPYEATIDHVSLENVGTEDKPEKKLTAFFQDPETNKAVVLNRTRCEALAEIAQTPDYAKWAGVKVRISKGHTFFAGKRVPCIVIGEPELPF